MTFRLKKKNQNLYTKLKSEESRRLNVWINHSPLTTLFAQAATNTINIDRCQFLSRSLAYM